MIVQSYEEFLQDREEEPKTKIVVMFHVGRSGYAYSQADGDFIIQDGNIIPTSERLISRIKLSK